MPVKFQTVRAEVLDAAYTRNPNGSSASTRNKSPCPSPHGSTSRRTRRRQTGPVNKNLTNPRLKILTRTEARPAKIAPCSTAKGVNDGTAEALAAVAARGLHACLTGNAAIHGRRTMGFPLRRRRAPEARLSWPSPPARRRSAPVVESGKVDRVRRLGRQLSGSTRRRQQRHRQREKRGYLPHRNYLRASASGVTQSLCWLRPSSRLHPPSQASRPQGCRRWSRPPGRS
jgi:hypothetical protein